jgi:hypothetical protein
MLEQFESQIAETDIYQNYEKQYQQLNKDFELILNEYVQIYPTYKMNPEYSEYENLYAQAKQKLNKNKSDFFTLKTELNKIAQEDKTQEKSTASDVIISKYDKDIEKIKYKNGILKGRLNSLKNNNNAAVGMKNQYKNIYDIELVYTIGLGGIVILLGYLTVMKLQSKNIKITESILK